MRNIRRFPGLKCGLCGSDEFEIELYFNQSDEVVGGTDYQYKMYLSCAHCPRVFPICGVRKMNDVSELFPQNCDYEEILSREE